MCANCVSFLFFFFFCIFIYFVFVESWSIFVVIKTTTRNWQALLDDWINRCDEMAERERDKAAEICTLFDFRFPVIV